MLILFLFLFQLALFAIGILGPWRDTPERKTNGRLPLAARMLLSFSLFVAAFIIGITDIRGISLKNANDRVWLT
jgi:hypothetical protein